MCVFKTIKLNSINSMDTVNSKVEDRIVNECENDKSSSSLFSSAGFWGIKDNLFSGLSSKLEAALHAGFDVAFTDSDESNHKMVTSNSSTSFSRKSKNRSVFGQPEINYNTQNLHRNKGQSLDSLDTIDSGQSMGSSSTSVSELRVFETHDNSKFYRQTESLGIGSGQSTSLESSDAEESATEEKCKRCDSRKSSNSSSSSCDSQIEGYRESKIFMKSFVNKVFNESNLITLEEKSKFGDVCRSEFGRLWFARYVNEQRVISRKVKESTFYSLAQYFAIVLFECAESDDFTPAKTLMNMCFTYYYENQAHLFQGNGQHKQYLYHVLREQPIWRSLRFWTAAFFDAIQCERAHRPTPTRCQLHQYKFEDIQDEAKFQENITFGQLGAFTHNMRSFGLSKEMCLEFLRKQSVIANLPQQQIALLRENIETMYL